MKTRYKTLIAGTAIAVMLGVVWHSCTKEVSAPIKSALKLNDSPSATERMVRDDAPSGNQFNVDFPNEASTATDGLTTAYSVCQKAFKDLDAWDGEMRGSRLFVDYNDRQTGYQIKASINVDIESEGPLRLDALKINVFDSSNNLVFETYENTELGHSMSEYKNKFGDEEARITARPFMFDDTNTNHVFSSFMATGADKNFEGDDFWLSENTPENIAVQKKILTIQSLFKNACGDLVSSPHTKQVNDGEMEAEANVSGTLQDCAQSIQSNLTGPVNFVAAGSPSKLYHKVARLQYDLE